MIHADATRPNRGSIYGAAESAGESAYFGRFGRTGHLERVARNRCCRRQRTQCEDRRSARSL
ncbi:uncharacterized protein HVO_A0223 (plasmid) [Haloferax volcanii DS2]|uniref:Uncharacterized protein n=1 Tax=Haloferax volcanii (strain ATCC 29605 / DSM 3757 / JCM 8879 / NBRC 14742 / NCIMB 2012 / VKM B-1768 / DS2) TaxID=309800 RepID=D4GQQ2_HALVD|nr:uncharacterized protein HVO_A0223 [Haloferax volcanii DS2]